MIKLMSDHIYSTLVLACLLFPGVAFSTDTGSASDAKEPVVAERQDNSANTAEETNTTEKNTDIERRQRLMMIENLVRSQQRIRVVHYPY